MGERGWGWTASKIRQVRFIEWLVPQSLSPTFVPVKPFYDAQDDSAALTTRVVHDELRELERQSLIYLAAGLGGIEEFDALATAQGRRLAEEAQARRADNRLRKVACRDAMIDWLSSQDATSPLRQPVRDRMLADPRYGTWLAESFSEADLDTAAAWLHRHCLVGGIIVEECEGPVRLYLTEEGVACAEEFCSSTAQFVAVRRPDGTAPGIDRSAGAQVGAGNVQVNHFYGPPTMAAGGGAPENDNKVHPETATWVVAIHASKGDVTPLGCGVVIDERRVLTCRHVVDYNPPGSTLGEIWVAFPNAEGRGADTRLLVESTEWPTVPEPAKVKDLAVLRLPEPVPAGVTPAPLQFPKPIDLLTTRWWAAGFPDGDPFGSTAVGTVKSSQSYGSILLVASKDADKWAPITHGFSGGGLWSPDHQAVVAVISQADGNGGGRAITLYRAAEWFPGEELKSLSGKWHDTPEALAGQPLERQDSREPAVPVETREPNYALMVWQKAGNVQRDWDGRLYGETGQGEDVQLDADRMWWPIARWRLDGLKALIFITDGEVNRMREVYGVDEETTGDSSSLALNVSAPLTADEIAQRLPTLREKLDAEDHDAVQGRLRKYLEF